MSTMLIVHKPGEMPRIGYPNPAKLLESLREWKTKNPGATIYVIQAQDLPTPGTVWVETIENAILIEELVEGPDEWPEDDDL
jgi:hypothetical protein